jgi:hypothetical protein
VSEVEASPIGPDGRRERADDLARLYSLEFRERLGSRAREGRLSYGSAEPFPHSVLDDFLPAEVVDEACEAFEALQATGWRSYSRIEEVKQEYSAVEGLPAPLRGLLHFFNSAVVLEFVELLTGINGLIPDPYFTGGGLHQISPGGRLEIHADFNWYERLRLDRRVNLLLYLNRNWDEAFGGHLELWDRSMTRCVKRVLPVYNRCVVFSTTSDAFHGHPEPLACPPGHFRRSLALYYYSNGRPEAERAVPHSTLWQQRPEARISRGFRVRVAMKRLLLRLAPPLFLEAYEALRKRVKHRGD